MPPFEDPYAAQVEAHVLGSLDPAEAAAFEAHLAGCPACRSRVVELQGALGELARRGPVVPPASPVREQLLDLAEAPPLPADPTALPWKDLAPGIRYLVHREDPARGVRGCLVWAQPGARHPRHRHLGDENILVLEGTLGDERGRYGPGEVCHSAPGSIHSEAVLSGEECFCYVVYYGELEALE